MDDPFIPQRGRRLSSGIQQSSNDGFADQFISIPLRLKRSITSTDDEKRMADLRALAYSLLHNSDALVKDYADDPFIPQRGRRGSSGVQKSPTNEFADQLKSTSLRRKRSAISSDDERRLRDLQTLAYLLLHNSDALITDYAADPFIPQRGRRSATSASNQQKVNGKAKQTARGRRSVSRRDSDEERLRELTHIAYSLLRKSEPLITDFLDDPFIPQRGRRSVPIVANHKNTKTKNPVQNTSRAKRSAKELNSDEERLRELTNFAYSLLRKSEPLITEFSGDPFIPQRGRRSASSGPNKHSHSLRMKRGANRNSDEDRLRELTNFAYSLLRKSESLSTDYVDDPFVPQRGRRPNWFPNAFDAKRNTDSASREEQMRQLTNLAYSFLRNSDSLITDYSDDPFIPQRGRRSEASVSDGKLLPFKRKPNAQSTENDRMRDLQMLAYSLLRNSVSDYADDPFIPQRGRRSKNNKPDKFIGKLLPIPLKRKRSAGEHSTEGKTKATVSKSQNIKNVPSTAAPTSTAHLLQKRQSNGLGAVVPLSSSKLNWCCGNGGHDKTTATGKQQWQQWQQWLEPHMKSPTTKFIVPNGFTNGFSDYANNEDEYVARAGVDESLASAKRILDAALETVENQQNNLSRENRDALYLARGSQTPFAAIEQKK